MAHIYTGNPAKVNPVVLESARSFPDDHWVFFEVDVGRNVDILVTKLRPAKPTAFFLTELKQRSMPLRGDLDNGRWEEEKNGEWVTLPMSNRDDVNPFKQAVNSINALSHWLWNNRARYLDLEKRGYEEVSKMAQDRFKGWPSLLLLSDWELKHEIASTPKNGYGSWFCDIDRWFHKVKSWRALPTNIDLSEAEVLKLVELLHLVPIEQPDAQADRFQPSDFWTRFACTMRDLDERLRRVEQRLEM